MPTLTILTAVSAIFETLLWGACVGDSSQMEPPSPDPEDWPLGRSLLEDSDGTSCTESRDKELESRLSFMLGSSEPVPLMTLDSVNCSFGYASNAGTAGTFSGSARPGDMDGDSVGRNLTAETTRLWVFDS